MAGYFMSILISSFDYFLFCFAFGSLFLLIEFGNLSLHYSAMSYYVFMKPLNLEINKLQ